MRLKLKNLDNYATGIQAVNDRRSMVTVVELTHRRKRFSLKREHVFTGRSWSVPFDPMIVTEAGLSRLIDSQVSGTPIAVVEPDRPAIDELLEVLAAVLVPIVSVCIHNTLNATKSWMQKKQDGETVEPEQVIIEQEYERTVGKLGKKLGPVVSKMVRQAKEAEAALVERSTINRLFRLLRRCRRV